MEEEVKRKEAAKLREIEVQKKEVMKMHETFGLESVLGDIEKAHADKDYQKLIEQSSKLEFLFNLMP
jgi:hypothetical protein